MRFGKPDVQRHDAGLRAEAEQGEQEGDRAPERREVLGTHVGEGVVAGVALQHAEAEQDADRADVGDQQVEDSPRWRISAIRWLAMTRKNDDSAIVSHVTMKAYASSASTTSAMLARKTWYWRQRRPGGVPSPLRK